MENCLRYDPAEDEERCCAILNVLFHFILQRS